MLPQVDPRTDMSPSQSRRLKGVYGVYLTTREVPLFEKDGSPGEMLTQSQAQGQNVELTRLYLFPFLETLRVSLTCA